ncbi:MAG: MFS transporter [Acetobacteraceae bacterium]
MAIAGTNDSVRGEPGTGAPERRRALIAASLAHSLHDGYTDQLYALLPVWQAQFGLSYAGLAALRALYYGTMSALQIPGSRMIRPLSSRAALVASTIVAASGFLLMSLPLGFAGLCGGLVLAGAGSSVQHPRASLLVTDAYEGASRGPLGIYNFAGDLGKATLPAMVAVLLSILMWRSVLALAALLGFAVGLGLLGMIPNRPPRHLPDVARSAPAKNRSGFGLLMAIGALDTAARMGFLLFLPFLIGTRGGTTATVGLGLALVFMGGALGKATCGWLGEHVGVVGSVIATEAMTALLIAASLSLPLAPMLALLPLLGIVLNGTSSVLYGSVPELAPKGDTGRAFAFFYTCTSGSSGLAPIAYGAIADHSSRAVGVLAAAATAALVVPLVLALRASLAR